MSRSFLSRRALLAGVAGLSLAGCATSGVVTGDYKVGTQYTVTLGDKWADISTWLGDRGPGVRLLTIDGPWLNRLYVVDGLRPGQSLERAPSRDRPNPAYRDNMTSRELVEFVVDSVAMLGYQAPEAANLAPAKFGGVDGVRFDIATRTKQGLLFDATALVAQRNGRLHLMLFLASREHYYAATLPEVEKIFASVVFAAKS
jgi:hypothetical protein